MKASGVLLFALASVLAMSVTHVQAAFIEIPDEFLDVVFIKEDPIREKRQLKVSGYGSEQKGTIRLDGEKNIFDKSRTRVDAKGFYQLDYEKGEKPKHTVGAEVRHNVWRGKKGQSLDLTTGYRQHLNSPGGYELNTGVAYKWK